MWSCRPLSSNMICCQIHVWSLGGARSGTRLDLDHRLLAEMWIILLLVLLILDVCYIWDILYGYKFGTTYTDRVLKVTETWYRSHGGIKFDSQIFSSAAQDFSLLPTESNSIQMVEMNWKSVQTNLKFPSWTWFLDGFSTRSSAPWASQGASVASKASLQPVIPSIPLIPVILVIPPIPVSPIIPAFPAIPKTPIITYHYLLQYFHINPIFSILVHC